MSQLGVGRARSNFHPPIRAELLLAPEAELLDQRAVALEILALEIVQQATAPSNELEQAAPRIVILRVGPQVLGELVDPSREERDLDRRRTRVPIAPAVLAYAWGFRSVQPTAAINVEQLGQLGWIFCLGFLICCAWRLARFNVQGMAPGSSKFFVGMPTPAAAGVIASLVHGFKVPLHDWRWSIAWFLVTTSLGALMTSTIRYYSFKDIPWSKKQPSLLVILLILMCAVVWKFSEIALVLFACTYAVTGVALHFVRFFRHRFAARTAGVSQ